MTLEPIEFEKLPKYNPKYEHLKCDCGGIIGAYNRDDYFTCEKCGKVFKGWQLDHDYLAVNAETGWMFPMNRRKFE